jgi:uncharacterized protein
MAIFREFEAEGKDRAAEDRRRHKQLVEESIKKNIGDIIAEESIIGQSKDKKIKIPIRGIKEFQFVYGKNTGTGVGDGSEKRGDVIGSDRPVNGKGRAGNMEGEEIYETEITIDELINYLFEDLKLPAIDRRKLAEIESTKAIKKLGYQRKGIPPRLAKKRSVIEKIKRKQNYIRNKREIIDKKDTDETKPSKRIPFMEDDLRYRRVRETTKKEFNAVVICIMDVSGSMDSTKKYIARSFYFLLYQFVKLRYSNVEIIFIAHTTTAREVDENRFFRRVESGGTYISSGYEKALEIIEQRYNPSSWNIYAFHCSDGDNWPEDNEKAVRLAGKLCEVSNLFGYGEILPDSYFVDDNIREDFKKNIHYGNFEIITMSKSDEIVPGLKKLLNKQI